MVRAILFAATLLGLLIVGGERSGVEADMKTWQRAVIKKMAEKQRYPRSAIQRGIQGSAKVRIFIAADGTITNHEVVEATGEKVLDREVPKLVERMSPLPALPDDKESMTLVLPINWKLN